MLQEIALGQHMAVTSISRFERPQLILKLMRNSRLLGYFHAFSIDFRSSGKDGEQVFFVYTPRPSAAVLLPDFFQRQIGIAVSNDIIERHDTTRHTNYYGIEIPFEAIDGNFEALEYIAANFAEHDKLMNMLHSCPRIQLCGMENNSLVISASKELCSLMLQLPGSQKIETKNITQASKNHDSISIPVIRLHHSIDMLEHVLKIAMQPDLKAVSFNAG
jgi:hypothetical protein